MSTDATFYLTGTISSFVLALQLTHFWWRCEKDRAILYWMAGCWMIVVTDCVFAIRSDLPAIVGKLLPTVMVTAAYGILYLGARQAAGLSLRKWVVGLAVAVQALGLWAIDQIGSIPNLRAVFDRLIWAGFCLAAWSCLRKASPHFWKSFNTPATIFLLQGVFFILRLAVAVPFLDTAQTKFDASLTFIGNVDVLLFNGSLFVSLLLALLLMRQEELASARVETNTLSGLLPVCAWCQKVRDDTGYWSEVAEYFARKNSGKLTHGICQTCASSWNSNSMEPPAA